MNESEYVEYLDTQITKVLREIEVNLINIYRVSIELQTCVKKPLPYLKELHDVVSPWCAYLRQLVSLPKESTCFQTEEGNLSEKALSQEEKNTLQEISNLLAHTTEQLSLNVKTSTALEEFDMKPNSTADPVNSPISLEKQQTEEPQFQADSPTTMWRDLLEKYSSSQSSNDI